MKKILVILLVALFLGFNGYVIYALWQEPLAQGFAVVTQSIWGYVTIADLYLGLFLFALFIFATSKSMLAALLWSLALFCLGNGVAVLYLLYSWRTKQISLPSWLR